MAQSLAEADQLRIQCSELITERDGAQQALNELQTRLNEKSETWQQDRARLDELQQEADSLRAEADSLRAELTESQQIAPTSSLSCRTIVSDSKSN